MPTTTVQSATTLKIGAGIIRTVNVCVAGAANGKICDAASTGEASDANAVIGLPSPQIRSVSFSQPVACARGITVVPSAGQTVWVDWE